MKGDGMANEWRTLTVPRSDLFARLAEVSLDGSYHYPALIKVQELLRRAGFDLWPIDNLNASGPSLLGEWQVWENEADMTVTFRQKIESFDPVPLAQAYLSKPPPLRL